MFKRVQLQRFNIYLGLFAILLISICPVITQTIALIGGSSSSQNGSYRLPSANHFECVYEFLKTNGLNADDFFDESLPSNKTSASITLSDTPHNYDEHSLAKCGYCDLLYSATVLVAFYISIFQTPSSPSIIHSDEPYLPSLNYWSISSRGPPIITFI